MNPLATPFVSGTVCNGSNTRHTQTKPTQKATTEATTAGEHTAQDTADQAPDVSGNRVELSPFYGPTTTVSGILAVEAASSRATSSEIPRNLSQTDADELSALRAANAALNRRLHDIESETPAERSDRKLRLKNDEIEELKISVKTVTDRTAATKKQLAERQAHLRNLNAQVARLQPAASFPIKDNNARSKKVQKSGENERE